MRLLVASFEGPGPGAPQGLRFSVRLRKKSAIASWHRPSARRLGLFQGVAARAMPWRAIDSRLPIATAAAFPSGIERLRNPALNKGTAFTVAERDALGLHGLLPPRVSTPEEQIARVWRICAARPRPSRSTAITNHIGNCTAAVVMASWENEIDWDKFNEAMKNPGSHGDIDAPAVVKVLAKSPARPESISVPALVGGAAPTTTH